METKTCFDSKDVMAYILGVCREKGIDCNLTKAQKLLYCCYGIILAAFGDRLTEEAPQAWQYGPVFPRTFRGLKDGEIIPGKDGGFSAKCDSRWLPLIDQTIGSMGKFSASRLSAWSHLPGSPWAKASNGGRDLFVQIPGEYIRDYFSHVVKHD